MANRITADGTDISEARVGDVLGRKCRFISPLTGRQKTGDIHMIAGKAALISDRRNVVFRVPWGDITLLPSIPPNDGEGQYVEVPYHPTDAMIVAADAHCSAGTALRAWQKMIDAYMPH